ncbi:hypothetical protein BWI17_13425 [Betaproteobacteria bacterium GR16-43]|nr:hypothetical protein BWI17_13425 [Betaproteobacteria bacterium GR16-43]
MKNAKPSSRRNFLLTAGLGTAGVAAAVATATRGEKPRAAMPGATEGSGYRLSEHVQKYYKTTKV